MLLRLRSINTSRTGQGCAIASQLGQVYNKRGDQYQRHAASQLDDPRTPKPALIDDRLLQALPHDAGQPADGSARASPAGCGG